jgi:hypothetical protein
MPKTSAYEKKADGKKVNPAKSAGELVDRGLSAKKKQIRARARRAHARNVRIDAEVDLLYKPLDEWDEEELAKGVPREMWGKKNAGQLKWLPRAVHEEIVKRYQVVVKDKLRELSLPAMRQMTALLENEEVDRRGRPIVSPNVKVTIIQLLLEHVVGKPTQRIEADVSMKLQGLLATVMVVPSEAQGEEMGKMQGFLGLQGPPPEESDDEED